MSIGLVFDVKRFAIYDGPGIRTTVFLKGCSLNCMWCQNPEGISANVQLFYNESKCINCHACVRVCPVGKVKESVQDRFKTKISCTEDCIRCYDKCPSGAIYKKGEYYSVDKLVDVCARDIEFYRVSGGGVTLSGGEPLLQIDFVEEFLRALKSRNIHVVVETAGYVEWDSIAKIMDLVDLFFYDLKIFDEKKHINYTGVSNNLILENLVKLCLARQRVVIRIPMIPAITDTEENLKGLVYFIKREGLKSLKVELLPYNPLAQTKYAKKGINCDGIKPYFKDGMETQPSEALFEKKKIFTDQSIDARVLSYE